MIVLGVTMLIDGKVETVDVATYFEHAFGCVGAGEYYNPPLRERSVDPKWYADRPPRDGPMIRMRRR